MPSLEEPDKNLRLTNLVLRNFRNHQEFSLKGLQGITILAGPNATGKTSVVEAIQLISALKSFRASQIGRAIRWGQTAASVIATIESDHRQLDLQLRIEEGKRSYRLNGKARRARDLRGLFPAVTFVPDDLGLAKGPSSARRGALDDLGAQISKNFAMVQSDYTKLVRQKNQALRDEASDTVIDSIDEVLTLVGVQILSHRSVMIKRLLPYFQSYYERITQANETADIQYIPCWNEENQSHWTFEREECLTVFTYALHQARLQERIRRKSVVGPHADKVLFLINGHDAAHFASQGQQRSLVLAYKLAEAAVIEETLNQRPILLLDDVMSELDHQRRDQFMSMIEEDIQIFITTTNLEYFTDEIKEKALIQYLGGDNNEA